MHEERLARLIGGGICISIHGVTGAGQTRVVNVNLTQPGQLYTPRLVVSENGTRVQETTRYIPDSTAPEIFNKSIIGNFSTGTAIEMPMGLQLGGFKNSILDDGTPVEYQFINGTFNVAGGSYTKTDAPLVINPPTGLNGCYVNITLFGTVHGDANNDGRVTMTDAMMMGHCAVGIMGVLPPCDYPDMTGWQSVFDNGCNAGRETGGGGVQ